VLLPLPDLAEFTEKRVPAALHLCVISQQLIDAAHSLRQCWTKPLLGAVVMTAGEEATWILVGVTSLSPVSASMWQHVIVSLLWFALSAQWMTVVPIIVPDQIAVIVGDSAAKEGISGTILAAGAVVALVIAPISGALSDRSQHRRGRRRPFLIAM
jgi:MFS family permease